MRQSYQEKKQKVANRKKLKKGETLNLGEQKDKGKNDVTGEERKE